MDIRKFGIRHAAIGVLVAMIAGNAGALKMEELKPPTPEQLAKIKAATPEKCEPPAKARKLLVFYLAEGFVHSSILYGNECFKLMSEKTGAFVPTFSKDKADLNAENLKQFDGIMFNSTTHLTLDDGQRKAIMDFVNGGKGIMGVHAASDNFNCCAELSDMLGGQFDGHPWGGGGTWAFKLDDPAHVLNRGFDGKGFVLSDEIYQIKGKYAHDNCRELISLDMSNPLNDKIDKKGVHRKDGDFPVSWIKKVGAGRVFYCSMGHREEIYWNKMVVQHYLDGIQYALGDFKIDDRTTDEAAKK